VVSHAGAALLRELATQTGLADGVTGALLDTYRGFPLHMPGQVFADLAVAIADGADAVTGIEVLRDREALFGPVASMPTAWRLLDRIDEPHMERVRAARAAARERAWAAGAAPDPAGELRIDFDATISVAFSEKENAAATWKKTFRFHPARSGPAPCSRRSCSAPITPARVRSARPSPRPCVPTAARGAFGGWPGSSATTRRLRWTGCAGLAR
jgi:hypothetical protein